MSQIEDNLSGENLDENKVVEADGQESTQSEGDSNLESSKNADKKGKTEQEIYSEVLEKLKLNNSKDSVQEHEMPFMRDRQEDLKNETYSMQEKLEKSQNQIQMEKIVADDFSKIDNFMRLGLIDSLQGQNLKKLVVKKAFDTVLQNEKIGQNSLPASKISIKNELFSDFNKNNPDFFSAEGRKEVLDYLKSDEVIIGKDDLGKISAMVENIEKSAVERYLKKEAYEKNLKESNSAAKQKLTANAQNSSGRDKNLSKTFTREQIGKMSSAEFIKYESMIMDQLKKGLIR